jgi:hypothetical protein
MSRFNHLLKNYTKNSQLVKKTMELFRARKEVDINGNGTSGHMVKHGSNKGKVLGHRSTKSNNNWQ